jgi:hypothetical protein
MINIDEDKLETLASYEGYDHYEEMLDDIIFDSTAPAICINPDCDYTTWYEPDQEFGYCERCGTQSVKSCLILAGIM